MAEIRQAVIVERIVSEPGVISITYDYQIPDNLTKLAVSFSDNWTEIQTSGFEINGSTCKWRDGYSQQPSIELTFDVGKTLGASSYVDTGEWAITRLPNMGWSWSYRQRGGQPELNKVFQINGEGAISNDGAVAYLGPFSEYTEVASETGEEFRLIVPQDATLRDSPRSILSALKHASSYLSIGAVNDSVLAIAAPTTAQNWAAKGTQRGDDGFWVRDDAVTSETNETWVHEYVHTRQRFSRTDNTHWFQEGTADYFAALAALERGDIEFDDFHQFLTSTRDRDAVLSETSTWRSTSTAYSRGRRACAGLDAFIKKDTDGAATLMDVLASLNRRFDDRKENTTIEVKEIRHVINAVTDRNMVDWFQKYVHGTQLPTIDTDPSVFLDDANRSDTGVETEPDPDPEPDAEPVTEPDPSHRCPICNKKTTEAYCPVCGHQFVSDVSISDTDPEINECPICEHLTAEQLCPICGHEFESASTDARESSGGSTGEPAIGDTCPICDTVSDTKLCPTCGYELT